MSMNRASTVSNATRQGRQLSFLSMVPDWKVYTRQINEIGPLEPLVKFGREYYTFTLVADKGDKCHCCGKQFAEGEPIVSDGGMPAFCNWTCLLKHAESVPHFYQIIDRGAY